MKHTVVVIELIRTVCICSLLVCTESSLYEYFNIKGESCQDGVERTETTTAPAGEITADIKQTTANLGTCQLTLRVPKDKRIALFFDETFFFPVDEPSDKHDHVCARGNLKIIDGSTGAFLTTEPGICGVVRESDNRPSWMRPHFSNNNSLIFVMSASSNFLRGRVKFTIKFVTFTSNTGDTCFPCSNVAEVDFPVCIDHRLKCDKVNNCPRGDDEDFWYTKSKQSSYEVRVRCHMSHCLDNKSRSVRIMNSSRTHTINT